MQNSLVCPDLRGTWSGLTNDALVGAGIYYAPSASPDEIRFFQIPIVYTINQQQGRNFSGTILLGGKTNPLVGVFSADGVSGIFAIIGGTGTFTLVGTNQVNCSWCSVTTDPNNASAGPVVSCHELTRL